MEHSFADDQKDGWDREDSFHGLIKDRELSGENGLDCAESKSKRLVRRVNSQNTLILKVKQLPYSKSCIRDSFLRSIHVLDGWIPKHMVTVDEKYLCHCLETIHASASKAAPCNISLNLDWGNMGALSNDLNPAKVGSEYTCNLARFDFDCTSGTGNVVISPAGQWIAGSIMSSKSMVNILKNPLLCQYGAFDADATLKNVSFSDREGLISYDFMDSQGGLSNYILHKPDKEASIPGNHKYGYENLHERLVSMSSTNSTCSDQSSSSSLSATVTQGVLQCNWKGGNPHFVFSLDDQKVVYVANLWKDESADDKSLDHMYLFHSRTGGEKEHEIHCHESHVVGKMKISTSFTLCPNNSRIMEREFVLFGSSENFVGEMKMSRHDLGKNKGLSKKIWSSHSIKKRTTSRFGGSSAILENRSWVPFQHSVNDIGAAGGASLLECHPPPNFELAAIIVKNRFSDNHEGKVGGWGLKFLKKVGSKQMTDTVGSSVTSASARNSGDCSTSLDVLIPAGLHGGPRTRISGPSTLIERWRSGGCCDCGGWDLGCPLTVLRSRSSNNELSSQADMQGECKLIDLFLQGSENGAPPLRMVNVYDGLYFVHFESTLSALQSFSIAVAFIHSQSPALQPKNVQQFK